jgi:beta-lactamase regulating signal transducer with metallopeptidase domain
MGAVWGKKAVPVLFPAWLLGVAIQFALAIRQWLAARRLMRSAKPLEHDWIRDAARQVSDRLRLRRLPPLLTSPLARGPIIIGPAPTRIVLPAGTVEAFSSTELRLALAHELAHARRGDLWLALIPGLARALFFFHPLAWLACRGWATAREAACDVATLEVTGAAPATYGRLLLKLAAAGAGLATAPGVGAAPSYLALRGRLLMLQNYSHRPRRWMLAGTAAVVTLAAIIALPWRLTAQTTEGSSPETAPIQNAADTPARTFGPRLPAATGRVHYQFTPPGVTLPLRQDWDGKPLWTATRLETEVPLSPALFQMPSGFEVEEFPDPPSIGPVFNGAAPTPSTERNAAMKPSSKRFGTVVADATLAAAAFSPNLARTDETAGGDPSTGNLKRLAIALAMYAQDYDEQLPPMKDAGSTRRVLLPYVRHDETVFVSPRTRQPYHTNASISGARVSTVILYRDPQMRRPYARYKATIAPERAAVTVTYYEATPAPDGTRFVLFLDGSVMRVRETDWLRIRQESGIR